MVSIYISLQWGRCLASSSVPMSYIFYWSEDNLRKMSFSIKHDSFLSNYCVRLILTKKRTGKEKQVSEWFSDNIYVQQPNKKTASQTTLDINVLCIGIVLRIILKHDIKEASICKKNNTMAV